MRIIVLSDIHANLPALEAALKGINDQRPDAIFCLGDLVNQNVWNNEVVDLIRQHHIATVQGNHDEGIGGGKTAFHFSYTFPEAKTWGLEAIAYTLRTIRRDNQEFLSGLPKLLRISVELENKEHYSIVLAHGSPVDINERLYRATNQNRFKELLALANADIMLTGNTHCMYHKVLEFEENGIKTYRHAINPGSIGRPKDGDWRSAYVMITIDRTKPLRTDPNALQVDFYRIAYDLGRAVKAIKQSGLSVYYGGCLITG